jgi:hypothetical protein
MRRFAVVLCTLMVSQFAACAAPESAPEPVETTSEEIEQSTEAGAELAESCAILGGMCTSFTICNKIGRFCVAATGCASAHCCCVEELP